MRNIFPNQEQTNNLFNQEKDVATKQDIQDLSNQIIAISDSLTNTSEKLNQYIASMGENITTGQINAVQAAISTLEATNATLTSANITSLTVSGITALATLTADLATISSDLTVGGNVTVTGDVKGANALFDEITATTANIANWAVENLTVNKVNAKEIEADDIKVNNSVLTGHLDSSTADIGTLHSSAITADAVAVDGEIAAKAGMFDEAKVGNIHWLESVDYTDTDVYLTLPHYENGTYYLRARGTNKTLFTIESFNSVDNYFVKWSQSVGGNIAEMFKLGNDENSQLCVHIKVNEAFKLEYATVCATPNVSAPNGSVNPPEKWGTRYPVVFQHGSKFFRLVDLANQGSESHVLSKRTTNVYADATPSYDFDGTSNITNYDYLPDQSLNTNDDVNFHTVHVDEFAIDSLNIPKDLTVVEKAKLPNIYNGPALTDEEKAALKDETLLIDENKISRKTTKEGAVQVKPFVPYDENNEADNRPLVYDPVNDVLKKSTGDIDIPGNLTVSGNNSITGNTTIGGTLEAGDTKINGNTVLGGTLEAGDTKINGNTVLGGTLDISGNTKITGDAFISGDLTVSGTVHSVEQEEVVTDGDTITLRANNNLPLGAGQVSGIVVNKYNGTDDLTVATGNDGTLRVGTARGTDTQYTNIALKHFDGKYYTFENGVYTLLDPQPSGNMTAWTGKEEVEGYTHYATVTFTVIDTTTLSPIATRDEEENMNDGGVVVWDGTSTSMKTVPLPTNNAQALVSKWTEDPETHVITKGYEWKSDEGNAKPVDVVEKGNMHAVTSNAVAIATGSKIGFLSGESTDIIEAFSMVGIPNEHYAKTTKQFCETIDIYNSGIHSLSIGGPAYGFVLWKHDNKHFVIDMLSYSDYTNNIIRVRKVEDVYTVYRYVI